MSFQNKAEELSYQICERSFLSLWVFANPLRGRDNKEICDILVVCDPDIILFSIKEISLINPERATERSRWYKKAVENSAKQLAGAERTLNDQDQLLGRGNLTALPLPPAETRRTHKISISLGASRQIPLPQGPILGLDFLHVLDEHSFLTILTELDTITDFVDYLIAKEAFLSANPNLIFEGGEEDLVAYYLLNNRSLPMPIPSLRVPKDLWRTWCESPACREKREANEVSYLWDDLIIKLSADLLREPANLEGNPLEMEVALRAMAREPRFSRRIICKDYREFLAQSRARKTQARLCLGPAGVTYVFLESRDPTRAGQKAELELRCLVAAKITKERTTNDRVVGIGNSSVPTERDFATDMCYLEIGKLDAAMLQRIDEMAREFDYFQGEIKNRRTWEYSGVEETYE